MRIEKVGRSLTARLGERRAEIEQAALTRIYSVSDPTEGLDPEYLYGLKAAVSAALQYGIEALERSEDRPAPIPTALLSQARRAARHGVELDTVLRRYLAGHALLDDFLIEEFERDGSADGGSLKWLMRVQATALDRLLAAVSEEYVREAKARPGSPEQRRIDRVERLLAGELLDVSGLGYDFDVHHLGAVVNGAKAADALRELAAALDRNLLFVPRAEDSVWGWLGGRRPLDFEQIERALSQRWPAAVALAIGEPGQGLAGWRLTHRQAQAALPIALRSTCTLTRYADVALLASILQDDLLATSLRQLYLAPLEAERDGGTMLRQTLRAYLAAGCNTSSAAAALGVKRHTVTNRLRTIEAMIARPLDSCTAEIDAVLRLQDLGKPVASETTILPPAQIQTAPFAKTAN